jgi:hypothetical protein
VFAKALELQGGMARIPLEKLEILAGQLLNFFRERIESLLELRCRPMHLEFSQPALLLRCFNFLPQEVEPARGGVPLDLSIPNLPISFDDPIPQPNEVVAR